MMVTQVYEESMDDLDVEKVCARIEEISLPLLEHNDMDGVKARARTVYFEALRAIMRETQRNKTKPVEPQEFIAGFSSVLAHIVYTMACSFSAPGADMAENIAEVATLIANMAIETMEENIKLEEEHEGQTNH